eukprot:478385_1
MLPNKTNAAFRKFQRSASIIKAPEKCQITKETTRFFTRYCLSKNWSKGVASYGSDTYSIIFNHMLLENVSIDFIYAIALYLSVIVGINKKCSTQSFKLFYCTTSKINAICDEFALILQTLEHINNHKLWKYVYSFLYNISASYVLIKEFISSKTSVFNYKPQKMRCSNKRYASRIVSIRTFFKKYMQTNNWKQGDKISNISNGTYDINSWILVFGDTEPMHTRMSLIYVVVCLLTQIIGTNHSLKCMSFILFKSVESQIEMIRAAFEDMLHVLEYHHNIDLWKYVYSFLHNLWSYYHYIKHYIGDKTILQNVRNYQILLRSKSMDIAEKYKQQMLVHGYVRDVTMNMQVYGLYGIINQICDTVSLYYTYKFK